MFKRFEDNSVKGTTLLKMYERYTANEATFRAGMEEDFKLNNIQIDNFEAALDSLKE